jgi:mono/diheme cytochrome c family protein
MKLTKRSKTAWLAFIALSAALSLAAVTNGSAPAPVTFNKDIAPLLFKNCASCHRPGEVAPFALLTYKDAAKRAQQLVAVTQSRYMPPWKPEPGYGEFHDVRRLSDGDLALIKRWADAGAPEGKAKDLLPAPKFTDGWQNGEPDLIVKMPQPFNVRADGEDIYQCFVVPLEFAEERYVSAVEIRPGNRRIVHHTLLYLDATGAARRLDEADPAQGYRSFGGPGFPAEGIFAGWAPGARANVSPPGVARAVKAKTDLVIQQHYHPSGKAESDQTTIGIYFAKQAPREFAGSILVAQPRLLIPAGATRQKITQEVTLPLDTRIAGIAPHMHLLGREMKVQAVLPDGNTQPLIWIKDWDFSWQSEYLFRQTVVLPKGTRLQMEAYYDNSAANPRNPSSPPRPVKWGEQTTDEMALFFIRVVSSNQEELRQLRQAVRQQLLAARNAK